MASQDLAVVLGKVGDHIALAVVECALGRLGVVPLLCVAGSDLTELVRVTQDGHIVRVVQLAIVCGRAKVAICA